MPSLTRDEAVARAELLRVHAYDIDLDLTAAAEADAAFVLEGARENGDIVSARKGVSDFRIEILGRAAHAGVEVEQVRLQVGAQLAPATLAGQDDRDLVALSIEHGA